MNALDTAAILSKINATIRPDCHFQKVFPAQFASQTQGKTEVVYAIHHGAVKHESHGIMVVFPFIAEISFLDKGGGNLPPTTVFHLN